MAVIFLILGVAIGKYKCYWLISGYNTASKEKKQKIDIENTGKIIAKMSYIVAAINFLGALAAYFFQASKSILISIFLMLIVIFYYVWKAQKYDHSSNAKVAKIILVVTMVLVVAINIPIFYAANKSSDVEVSKDFIKITGTYGRTIPKDNITEIKLIDNIPEIKIKTNGIGLGKIQKGNYKLEGINKGVLFLENNDGPFIQITTKSYTVFINYKDDAKTLNIYKKINNEFN